MEDLPKKLRLPRIKIKRENLVITGLIVIALAIPLTVALAGVRQELRKRAAPTTGSIKILDPDGDGITTTRNVIVELTAPTQQASLLKPNLKVPQAHAANCVQFQGGTWNFDTYENTYYLTTSVCNVTDGATQISARVKDSSDPNIGSASGGLGTQTLAAGACRSVTFTFNMVSGWTTKQGTIATAKVSAASRNVGDWGCYQNLIQTVTFGSAGAPTPTPTPTTPGVTPTPTPTTPPGVTPTPTTPARQTPTPEPTPSGPSCDAACKSRGFASGYCDTAAVYPSQSPCESGETNIGWTQDCYVPSGTLGIRRGCCCRPATPTPTPTPRPTIIGMMVSNYSDFRSGDDTYSGGFNTNGDWTLLPGADGSRTVYAKFQWSDGTWTTPVSDTITLQTTGPTPIPTSECSSGADCPSSNPCKVGSCVDGSCQFLNKANGSMCVVGGQVGKCQNGVCVPEVAPTPTPTPTPTPPAGEPTAYLDKLQVGCHPWMLTKALLGMNAHGHSDPGNEVGFAFKYSGPTGERTSGLVPAGGVGQHASEVGHWVYSTEDINRLFPFGSNRCCMRGTHTITAYAAVIERDSGTGEVKRVSDWSAPRAVTTTVGYKDPYGHASCIPVEDGEIVVQKPVISNMAHAITGDTGREGYANINITYNTDIDADCSTVLYLHTGTNWNQQDVGKSSGTAHSYSDSGEWYSAASSKSYRYQAHCAKEGYSYLGTDVWAYSDYGYFTLPSDGGGGSGGAPPAGLGCDDIDLNGNGVVDIGDWSVLVENYGQVGENIPGDFNGDGEVNILDISMFNEAYGRCVEE